jgi:hypothetical protein
MPTHAQHRYEGQQQGQAKYGHREGHALLNRVGDSVIVRVEVKIVWNSVQICIEVLALDDVKDTIPVCVGRGWRHVDITRNLNADRRVAHNRF